jgi:hypothetical protein
MNNKLDALRRSILVFAGAGLFVGLAARTLLADDICRDFGSNQLSHPRGGTLLGVADTYMACGYHADENRICGSRLVLVDGSANGIDGAAKLTQNQRFGMLSTDEGYVMIGLHGGTNELLEQPLPEGPTYRYYFTYGDESWAQFGQMHACRSGDGLVGIHGGQNVLTAVTARTPPPLENEPKSPEGVDVYLDLLASDALVTQGHRDEIRIYANGEPIIKDDVDALQFERPGAVKGRSANGFITKKNKTLGKMLKIGTIQLDAKSPRHIVLSFSEGSAAAKTQEVLAGIKELCSKGTADENDKHFSEAVARLTTTEDSSLLLGSCIVSVGRQDEGLKVNWSSGDADQNTVVAAALERQARFRCTQDNGRYWVALHVEVR